MKTFVLDFKTTVWERVIFENEEQMLLVKSKLESGELTSGNAVANEIERYSEAMDETATELDVILNDGRSTIEILNVDTGEVLYKNGESNS